MLDLTPHFERLRKRFQEVEAQLSEGSVFSNPQKAQEITREHSRLKTALTDYEALQEVTRNLSANEKLLADGAEQDPEFLQMLEAEQEELKAKFDRLSLTAQAALLPADPDEERNVIIEIRAGTGGSEAALFAADLYRMYTRYIEKNPSWKWEVMDLSPGELGGIREVIFQVIGENVYRQFQFESGVHRVQRVPATEAQGRIHTSTATVAVLPEAKEVDIVIRPDELRIEVCRSGGPGGQGVNTTDSAVQVLHIPSGMIVRCQDSRSQIKNREKALNVLRSRLLEKQRLEEEAKYAANRKSQVGTGDRNEKIRTYNYPQNRITDHRINLTLYNLSEFMEGSIEEMLEALLKNNLEMRLAELQ
jgi:peptide chain release factor 1